MANFSSFLRKPSGNGIFIVYRQFWAGLIALLLLTFPVAAQEVSGNDKSSLSLALPVFYITNRKNEAKKYKAERSDTLEFGCLELDESKRSRLYLHRPGQMAIAQEQFFTQIQEAEANSGNKGVILFVHGYDCSFEKALKFGHRLSLSSGVPVVVFSWPSRSHSLTYAVDECTAEWSSRQFSEVMQLLGQKIGSGRISLVAHSLGCRLVSWALQSGSLCKETFRHILFCSPDIDTGIFKNTLRAIVDASRYVAVFASRRDVRLELSAFIHGNNRLGYINGNQEKNQGVHFIDLSHIDRSLFGHAIPYAQIAGIIGAGSSKLSEGKL